jgi:hypothetical protein
MGGMGTKTVWAAAVTVVALLSATAGLIGNLGGARDTICSLAAAKQTCIKSGLVTEASLERANSVSMPGGQAGAPPSAPVHRTDISGTWAGYYFGGGNPRTKFELDLSWRAPGTFRGVIAEEDWIGPNRGIAGRPSERGSSVKGVTSEDGSVSFTKEYDGADGVNHKVIYEGVLDESGRTITGTWSIDDLHGEFKVARN